MWQMISWAAMLTCVAAFWFNIQKKKTCFFLWELAAVALILVNLFWTHDYAQMSLNGVYLFFNAYGYIRWRKDERKQMPL